ncbi:unnamed protein product [Cochlearia groenlandica]
MSVLFVEIAVFVRVAAAGSSVVRHASDLGCCADCLMDSRAHITQLLSYSFEFVVPSGRGSVRRIITAGTGEIRFDGRTYERRGPIDRCRSPGSVEMSCERANVRGMLDLGTRRSYRV